MAGYAHGLVEKVGLPARPIMEKHRNPAAILADASITYDSYAAGELFQARDMSVLELADESETEPHFMGADDAKFYEGGPNYSTRPRLQAALTRRSWQGGTVLSDGKVFYRYYAPLMMIPDMHGVEPFGDRYADHYGYNEIPGTTDMSTAIQRCVSNSFVCNLFAEAYGVGTTVSTTNRLISGAGKNFTTLVGLATLGLFNPILDINSYGRAEGIGFKYDDGVLTGSEARGERVAVDITNSTKGTGALQDFRIWSAGTAIYGVEGYGELEDGFNYSLSNGFIQGYTYRALDIDAETGHNIENVYVERGLEGQVVNCAVRLSRGYCGNISQLNVHETVSSDHLIQFHDLDTYNIGSIHCEHNQLNGDDTGLYYFNRSTVNISACSWLHTAFKGNNQSYVKLGDAGKLEHVGNAYGSVSTVTLNNVLIQGANHPGEEKFPGYSPNGLIHVPGFIAIDRVSGATGRYRFGIGNVQWGVYTAAISDQEKSAVSQLMAHAPASIEFFSAAGHQENFVPDSQFDQIVDAGPFVAGAGETVQTIGQWHIKAVTGEIRASVGIGGPTSRYLSVENTGTTGEYQELFVDIPEFAELMDRRLSLVFLARAGSAGTQMYDFALDLQNAAGAPTSVFNRIALAGATTRTELTTDWRWYAVQFPGVVSDDVTSYGSDPFMRLRIRLSDAMAGNDMQFDLAQIGIVVGETARGCVPRTRPNRFKTGVEIGSNANGHYEMYDDGRLICRRYIGAAATDLVWTFPVPAIDTAGSEFSLSALARNSGAPVDVTEGYALSNSGVTFKCWDSGGSPIAAQAWLKMEGRWK